ncbi:MAG: Na-translocating system protein MpsC family protein, partial [Geitlerinemataceae cyanobacterium]
MKTSELTRGQVERTISQRIQALYRDRIGHQPSKVTCELFEDKLTIILEDS